jgi:hypothetical protein
MECTKYREQINQFIDGELEMRPQVELFRHLADCAPCQTLIDGLVRLKEDIRNERIPYPPELDDAILGRILNDRTGYAKWAGEALRRGSVWSRQVSAPAHLAASLAIVIIAVGILLGRLLFPSNDPQPLSAALHPGFAQPQTVIFVYGMPPVEVLGTPVVKTLNKTSPFIP